MQTLLKNMVLPKKKPPLLKRAFKLSIVTPYAYITIIFTFLVCGNLNAQQLRKWTNTEGRSFSGTIVDCDGETAKYKVFGRNKLVEIPLSQLCPADRRIAVIEAYKLVPC